MPDDEIDHWLHWGRSSADELVVPAADLADDDEGFVLAGGPSRTRQPVLWQEHAHATHEVLLPLSGLLTVQAGQRLWTLPPGRGAWIPARHRHAVRAEADTRFLTVYLAPAHSRALGPGPTPVTATPLLTELVLHLTLRDMPDDARRRGEQVVVDLLVPTGATHMTIPSREPVAGIARKLLADPADDRTLEQWARTAGTSTSSLGRAFRATTGVAFGRWRTDLRMNVAMALLAGGATVGEAADRVGYATSSAFIAVFRREVGVTPGAFRDRDEGDRIAIVGDQIA